MPIYEYRCGKCGRRSSVFVRSMSVQVQPKCEHCGSARMSRLMSRVVVARGAGSIGDLDESTFADVDESDPRSMARWARKMRDQLGDDAGPEFDEAIAQLESGEMPSDDDGGWLDEDG
jgi:putative FmdB family regulatory protein